MDKYADIKQKLIHLAGKNEEIKAVIAIGSSTRTTAIADEYSDLDLMIVTENVNEWLYGNYPGQLGELKISFVEPTLGGGKERRVLFDGYLDVDMIIFTTEQFQNAVLEGVAGWVMNRGYQVLYDGMGCSDLLKEKIVKEIHPATLSEADFNNMVNDFFFHVVWASKKILRGELWSAKMCVDAYLKNYLLKVIEMYSHETYGVDVWHDGRFLDRWAEEGIKEELKLCFAHYDKDDIKAALLATEKLFARLARKVAEKKGYEYPADREEYARNFQLADR